MIVSMVTARSVCNKLGRLGSDPFAMIVDSGQSLLAKDSGIGDKIIYRELPQISRFQNRAMPATK